MDFSKFKTSDWLKIGGALIFLIFGFMGWITAEVGGIEVPGGDEGNVFDFFWTGTLPWILVLGTGVITFLLVQGSLKKDGPPWPLIMLGATGLAALLLLIRVIFNPLENSDVLEAAGFEFGRGIGMIGSVIGGLLAFAGSVMGYTESGGNLSDLKDVNKMKSQFGGSGGGNPPPPPGMPPPPPPR